MHKSKNDCDMIGCPLCKNNKLLKDKLISKQSTSELERKAKKASRKGLYTEEDINYGKRRAKEMRELFRDKDIYKDVDEE